MERDGLCLQCMARRLHIWHDNGTRNHGPAVTKMIKDNAGPTLEGDGYDDRDQEDK